MRLNEGDELELLVDLPDVQGLEENDVAEPWLAGDVIRIEATEDNGETRARMLRLRNLRTQRWGSAYEAAIRLHPEKWAVKP